MARPVATETKAAPWWDPDESVTFRKQIKLVPRQEWRMRIAQREKLLPLDTPEKVIEDLRLFAENCLVFVDSWTLRDRSTPYKEGKARPILDRTAESIMYSLDEDDAVYIQLRGELPTEDAPVARPEEASDAGANFPDEAAQSAPLNGAGTPALQAAL